MCHETNSWFVVAVVFALETQWIQTDLLLLLEVVLKGSHWVKVALSLQISLFSAILNVFNSLDSFGCLRTFCCNGWIPFCLIVGLQSFNLATVGLVPFTFYRQFSGSCNSSPTHIPPDLENNTLIVCKTGDVCNVNIIVV